MKKLLFLASFLLLASCQNSSKTTQTKTLSLLHFNDVYQIEPVSKGKLGGAARVKTLIDGLKNEKPLVLFSGDAFSGASLSSHFKGSQMVEGFNKLGLDYAVCGNHELDYGTDNAIKNFKESNFPWLCANLVWKDTGKRLEGTTDKRLFEWNGVRVGLIGLAGDWLNSTKGADKLKILDPITSAKGLVKDLKAKGADIIIALTHMDIGEDRALAKAVPEIALILGGHEHHHIEEKVGNTLIWKSDADWRHVGKIQIEMKGQKITKLEAQNIKVDDSFKADEAIAAWVKSKVDAFESSLKEVLTESKVDLDVTRGSVRRKEANGGNLVADALRHVMKTDIAFANGGGLRTDDIIPAGPITAKDIKTLLPFNNKIVVLELTGKALKDTLEIGGSEIEDFGGGFPQVSGMSFSLNPKAPVGDRVSDILVGGKPVSKDQKITLATNDYIAGGGNNYATLKASKRITTEDQGQLDFEIVKTYLKTQKSIAPKVEGRIKMVSK